MAKDSQSVNNAFYQEVCILRLLAKMGYLDEKAFRGIVQIAAEVCRATLILSEKTLCLNC